MHSLEKKNQMNPLEGAPKRAEEAAVMRLTSLKKVQSEYSIPKQKLKLLRKDQEARARQQELWIELLRKQTGQQEQISQALMNRMQNLVKK